VDQHGRRRENRKNGPKSGEDNDQHLGFKERSKGHDRPKEDEECARYEEHAGNVEGLLGPNNSLLFP